ncbi:MAG: hypothetical protein A2007_05475 [Verrucomicrobia bacterium GWC2_42_7]|nr:MAG: hypothetical protein A2007_05475 [Verrucomicrobia bacterium GWC2_42_7]
MHDDTKSIGDIAAELYHKPPERYNCAQCILKAFNQSPEKIAEFKAYGGGRAPGGLCGALFAAKSLKDPIAQQHIEDRFIKEVGSALCKEIRSKNLTPCTQCVRIAANIVKENLE